MYQVLTLDQLKFILIRKNSQRIRNIIINITMLL